MENKLKLMMGIAGKAKIVINKRKYTLVKRVQIDSVKARFKRSPNMTVAAISRLHKLSRCTIDRIKNGYYDKTTEE